MSKESLLLNKNLRDGSGFQKYLTPAVLLGFILFLGIALRFYNLGTESYWIDEMSTVVEGQQNLLELFTSGRLDQPPAYYLPFHFWVQLFGTSEVSTRSFSALVGAVSIVLIYLIGRELFGKEVGLLAAFLMTISEFQIYYSQEARFYSFFEFAALLSFLFFVLAINRSGTKINFAFYVAASVLMVYSHAYGVFVLAAQAMFFILQWKKYRELITTWFICQVVIFLAILPYFYPLVFGGNGLGGAVGENIGGLAVPVLLDLLRSVYRFIMSPRGERSWGVMFVNYAIAAVLFVAGMWIYTVRQGVGKLLGAARSWFTNLQEIPNVIGKLLLLICWLLFPILLPFVLSLAISPMYLDRYTISAAPALYLLLALGIFSIRKIVPAIISIVLLLVITIPSLGYYYATDLHEQWREAATYIDENSWPDEVIVFAPNQGIGIEQKTFNWYYHDILPSCGLGNELIDSIVILEALKQCVSGHDRFWVIIRDRPEELSSSYRYTSFFLNPDQADMRLIKEHHFVKVSVYLFELTKR